MRYYVAAFIFTALFILPWFAMQYPNDLDRIVRTITTEFDNLASVIVHKPKTVDGLKTTYKAVTPEGPRRVRVLVVPGHEPSYGGAEYGLLKERELVLELSSYLLEFLRSNHHYETFTTRSATNWNETFLNYFQNSWEEIKKWQEAHKGEFTEMVRIGEAKHVTPTVFHVDAPRDIALRLYGIDKWSNENDIDIIVHVHLNDYPRRNSSMPGIYNGFAIYIPEKYYYNSTTTAVLAQTVFQRLSKYNPVSNLPGESGGIIPDQDLIAVGSYNSVNAASMLIEYGYLYEPQFTNPALRNMALKDLAFQTYLGLEDFFDKENAKKLSDAYDTLILPYVWDAASTNNPSPTAVYALQTALLHGGYYPPVSKNANDCPRTGKFGPCTMSALKRFQEDRKIQGETGLGPKTIKILNKEFGLQSI